MDIKLRYQNDCTVFNGVQSYEDLLQEIYLKYPLLINIELTYLDEEGDVIQVSNTSDIIALVRSMIDDLQTEQSRMILQMDAQIDQVKFAELKRLQKEEDQKQKKLQDQRNLLEYEISKEMENYQLLNLEKSGLESKYKEEIEELMERCKKLRDTEREPMRDFRKYFYSSNILGLIREKESNLLLMEDKTGFDTQLQLIQKEVYDEFEKLLQQRMLEHQVKHNNWLEQKFQINQINQEIQFLETKKQEQFQNLDWVLKKSLENVANLKAQLNQPPRNDDYQFDQFMF